MHKQRIGIMIAAGVGAIGTFLPWVYAPIIGSVPGTVGDGWITFILFIITIGTVFIGKREEQLANALLPISIIPSILASIFGIWKIIDFNSAMSKTEIDNPFVKAFSQTVGIGIGLYMIVFAGIAVVVTSMILKKSSSDIKESINYDNLVFNKDIVNNKSNNNSPKLTDSESPKEIYINQSSAIFALFCSQCGSKLREKSKYCSKCGHKVLIEN